MGFAFSIFILFLFLSPGIAFRFSFQNSDTFQLTIDSSIISEFGLMTFSALFFHLLGMWIVESPLIAKEIQFKEIYALLLGEKEMDFSLIKKSYSFFILYITILSAFGYFIGSNLKRVVLKYNWDQKTRLLNPSNDWDYLLSGRINNHHKDSFIMIDALVEGSEGDIIYSGVLEKYFLNKDKNLDRVYLKGAFRRKLIQDAKLPQNIDTAKENDHSEIYAHFGREFDERYYQLPGDYLVIPFSQIKNLNISFCSLDQVS